VKALRSRISLRLARFNTSAQVPTTRPRVNHGLVEAEAVQVERHGVDAQRGEPDAGSQAMLLCRLRLLLNGYC